MELIRRLKNLSIPLVGLRLVADDSGPLKKRKDRDDTEAQGAADDPPKDDELVDDEIFPAIEDMTPEEEADWADVPSVIGNVDQTPDSEKLTIKLEIPIRTIITVILTIIAIYLFTSVWSIFLLVFVAFMIALALLPPMTWLQRLGLPKVAAAAVCFVGLIGTIALIFALIIPPLIDQTQMVIDDFPGYRDRFDEWIKAYPWLEERYKNLVADASNESSSSTSSSSSSSSDEIPWESLILVGSGIIGALTNIFFVLILTFYLLLEGERSYKFLARYFTPRLRFRLRKLFPELTRVVSGYVIGQVITSLMFGIFAFIVLTVAGVPQPLLLAVIAAVMDAVPLVGVPVALIPAVGLAMTESLTAGIIVLVAYLIYQQIENYVIVPRIFGSTLQVSSLSILLGVLVGQQLLGVLGILLALPITAAIPVIERIWTMDVPKDLSHEDL